WAKWPFLIAFLRVVVICCCPTTLLKLAGLYFLAETTKLSIAASYKIIPYNLKVYGKAGFKGVDQLGDRNYRFVFIGEVKGIGKGKPFVDFRIKGQGTAKPVSKSPDSPVITHLVIMYHVEVYVFVYLRLKRKVVGAFYQAGIH